MDFTVTQDIAKYQALLSQTQNNTLGDIKAGQITSAQKQAEANQMLSNIDGSLEKIANQSNTSREAISILNATKSRVKPL